jgi:hypothetical protein
MLGDSRPRSNADDRRQETRWRVDKPLVEGEVDGGALTAAGDETTLPTLLTVRPAR